MDGYRQRRRLLPLVDSLLSGFYSICASHLKPRSYRIEKDKAASSKTQRRVNPRLQTPRANVPQTRRPQTQRRPWLTFKLSPKDNHREHDCGCFIDHLCDFIKLHSWIDDSNDELISLAEQYEGHLTHIVELDAKVNVHTQPDRPTIELGSLEEMRRLFSNESQRRKDLQDEICTRERELRTQLEIVKVHAAVVREQIYQSSNQFYDEVNGGRIPRPIFMDKLFIIRLGRMNACAMQLAATRKRLNSSRQTGPDRDFRIYLARELEGLRSDMQKRDISLCGTDVETDFGDRADLIYLPTESNLQRLQDHLKVDTDEDDEDEYMGSAEWSLSRQDDRLPDGRPRAQSERSSETWSDFINGAAAPHAELENEVQMMQLAEAIFGFEQRLADREQRLHDVQNSYFGSLSEAFLILPSLTRERFEQGRVSSGDPPFVEEEARFSQEVDHARRNLREAQRAMRSYIDSKRVPTESTFREQTNDRNSGNDAPGRQMTLPPQADTRSIRDWQARISRQAVPSRDDTLLTPSDSSLSVDLDSVRYSEKLSNGNGSTYETEIVTRKEKWLRRNQAFERQKRQYLESQGVVFEKDAIVNN